MSRLIELDDVLQTIDDFSSDKRPEGLKERLWKIQPVDAVPVVHGRWIEDGYIGEPFVCSLCGEVCRDTIMMKPRWKYCPMCGADMRDGKDGDVDG